MSQKIDEKENQKKNTNLDIIHLNLNRNINKVIPKNTKENRYQDIYKNKKPNLFSIENQKRIKRNIIKNKEIMSNSIEKKPILKVENDLFYKNKSNSCEKRKGKKVIPKILNRENILYNDLDLEEYTKELKDYQSSHRNNNTNYDPDKYINSQTSDERYFKAYYDDNISLDKGKNTKNKEEQLKKYIHDRKYLKNEIKILNDTFSTKNKRRLNKQNQKRNKSEEKRFFADSKHFPKYNSLINKQIELESHIFNTELKKEKGYFEQAKEIYHRVEKYQKNKNKTNKRIFKNHLNIKHNKKTINKDLEYSHVKKIKSENLQKYANNTISYTKKMKDINILNNSKDYDLITGRKIIKKIPSKDKKKKKEKTDNIMIEEIIESIPNLSEHNKIQIRMKASVFDLKNDEDLSKRRNEFIKFYKTNPNKNKKNEIITLKIGEKNNDAEIKADNFDENPSEKYIMTYRSKGTYDKFDSSEIKDIFCQKGIQAYDIHSKNSYNGDNINTISFRLKGENDEKIKTIENELKKENYKLKIRKYDNKININNEKDSKVNEEKKFKIMPKEIIERKGVSKHIRKS